MFNFTISSIIERSVCGIETTEVQVTMPAKDFLKAKRSGQLGMLYGVDISNFLARTHGVKHAYNPTVEDRARSSKGIKTVGLTYYRSR